MNEEHKGFLSRWSQRKVQVRQGVAPGAAGPAPAETTAATPLAVPVQIAPPLPLQVAPSNPGASTAAAAAGPDAPAAQATQPPRPTLQDVEALTPESDFTRFMARDVDPQVKNSAMKKLFADPHYNVMDRLDTYIDDYNTPDPIPKAMFRQMVQARMLGLLDDEMEDQFGTLGSPLAAPMAPPAVASSVAPEGHEAGQDVEDAGEAGKADEGIDPPGAVVTSDVAQPARAEHDLVDAIQTPPKPVPPAPVAPADP